MLSPLKAFLQQLKPTSRLQPHTPASAEGDLTLYDKIEEIFSLAHFHNDSSDIVTKFQMLSVAQQQLTFVTLIEHDMVDTIELVLRSGFDPNFMIRGQTPLHYVITQQSYKMLKAMLSSPVDVEAKDLNEQTALTQAVKLGNPNLILCLLEHGALVNTQDKEGVTPLGIAIQQRNPKAVALLKKYGAAIKHKTAPI